MALKPGQAMFAVLALFLATLSVAAQDFEKGLDAYKAGDHETALQDWRPLADQGHAEAQYELGIMYAKGLGVTEDDAAALRWFRRAADQGNAQTEFFIGWMYVNGEGVAQDHAESLRWYRRAAGRGHAPAQIKLGNMYGFGEGTARDDVLSHMWYSIAAANGSDFGEGARKIVEEQMTAAQIGKAEALARRCLKSGYTDCDRD